MLRPSPEAIRGDRVDIRSDIYALGVIACYTLTGRLPYRTDSVAAVLHAIANGDLDYAHLPVTEELRDVIRRATARLPEDRYQHPAEFRDALLATPEATEEPPTEEMPARDAATPSWDPFPDDMPTRRVPRELVPAVPPEPILPGEPETWSEMSRWPRTGRPEATREPEPGEGPAPEQEEAATPDEPTDEPSEEPRPHEDHEPTESTREPEPEPEHEPPLVYGVTCEEGHFTDPRPPFCAVCRGLLPEQALVQGPRPPLGELRLDDGRTLPLTRNYVIGRIPEETPEAESGAHTPVQLTDPGQSISRRHVTVTLDGWDVLFTDLGSANGTYVRPPGDADFYEIPPNEPVQLGPGCTIRVGIERTLTLAGRRDPGPR